MIITFPSKYLCVETGCEEVKSSGRSRCAEHYYSYRRQTKVAAVFSKPSPGWEKPLPIHIVIPDTQVKPGVPTAHLSWIGRYIAEKYAGRPDVTIIQLGDHWDMPSLSSYDKGKKAMEGRRYRDDIDAGNAGFELLDAPISAVDGWNPRKVFLFGNHEDRIRRAAEDNAQLEGTVDLTDCDTRGWERHDFLEPVRIDGITYAHYFYNPMNGRAVAGMIETRLKTIGTSFTQGHQQTLMYGLRPVAGTQHHGLVAGACYLHDEDYLGPQGNDYWRGIVICYAVTEGRYDPKFVSLDSLCRRYEGCSLAEFRKRIA